MKFLLSLILVLAMIPAVASGYTNDHKSYREAIKYAQKIEKPTLVLFTAEWCEPCQQLKNDTLYPLMPKLKKIVIVYFVDIDSSSERRVMRAYSQLPGVWKWDGSVPTMYLTGPKSRKLRKKTSGYMSREEFIEWFNN